MSSNRHQFTASERGTAGRVRARNSLSADKVLMRQRKHERFQYNFTASISRIWNRGMQDHIDKVNNQYFMRVFSYVLQV